MARDLWTSTLILNSCNLHNLFTVRDHSLGIHTDFPKDPHNSSFRSELHFTCKPTLRSRDGRKVLGVTFGGLHISVDLSFEVQDALPSVSVRLVGV